MAEELNAEPEFNMDAAVDEIGAGLGLGEETETTEPEVTEPSDSTETTEPTETAATPTVRAAPKSWAKDTHEVWSKLPPEAQAQVELREKQFLDGFTEYKEHAGFGKQLREVVAPFQQMLDAHKVDVPKAVSYLLGAHQRLTYGSPESRMAAYQELGRNLGLDPNAPAPDPKYQALEQKVSQIESGLTARQQADAEATRERIGKEVETFATDPKNIYFDECADHIERLINAGYPLQEAYETAVMANPVTREKETVRIQTETEKRIRENLRLDGLKGKRASSTNVRSRDTSKAPTDPLGTMEETMKDTLREIKSRAH